MQSEKFCGFSVGTSKILTKIRVKSLRGSPLVFFPILCFFESLI
ncbi:hypothetical protein LEP1GSC061_1288 [Leptospira wolffii serovar Khorat str. Khorat-H2]|nr:hypothetical protein LEP1GSC061_1288 [Leptospira wolffii serovar Khorat str. Khorat-H2]